MANDEKDAYDQIREEWYIFLGCSSFLFDVFGLFIMFIQLVFDFSSSSNFCLFRSIIVVLFLFYLFMKILKF